MLLHPFAHRTMNGAVSVPKNVAQSRDIPMVSETAQGSCKSVSMSSRKHWLFVEQGWSESRVPFMITQ